MDYNLGLYYIGLYSWRVKYSIIVDFCVVTPADNLMRHLFFFWLKKYKCHNKYEINRNTKYTFLKTLGMFLLGIKRIFKMLILQTLTCH